MPIRQVHISNTNYYCLTANVLCFYNITDSYSQAFWDSCEIDGLTDNSRSYVVPTILDPVKYDTSVDYFLIVYAFLQ